MVYVRTEFDYNDTEYGFGWWKHEFCKSVSRVEDCVWMPVLEWVPLTTGCLCRCVSRSPHVRCAGKTAFPKAYKEWSGYLYTSRRRRRRRPAAARTCVPHGRGTMQLRQQGDVIARSPCGAVSVAMATMPWNFDIVDLPACLHGRCVCVWTFAPLPPWPRTWRGCSSRVQAARCCSRVAQRLVRIVAETGAMQRSRWAGLRRQTSRGRQGSMDDAEGGDCWRGGPLGCAGGRDPQPQGGNCDGSERSAPRSRGGSAGGDAEAHESGNICPPQMRRTRQSTVATSSSQTATAAGWRQMVGSQRGQVHRMVQLVRSTSKPLGGAS